MRIIHFLIIFPVFLSCAHDKVNPVKPTPVITINTPLVNQHFVAGDTIHITGTVVHTVELTQVAVDMTDLSTGSEFFHNHFGAGNKLQYSFDAKYGIPDKKRATFKIEVEGIDKEATGATKELTITIN